jgi:crossover junction endonuclease MUS81
MIINKIKMSMLLLVDFRERKILEMMKYKKDSDINTVTISGIKVKYKVVNLEVGDFVFKNEDTDGTILVVERKSIKDLCASIMDGRFRQQKERILESVGDNEKVLYIIEGSKKEVIGKTNVNFNNLSQTIIDSSIINLVFKHKYRVLTTVDENDTLDSIILLYKKIAGNEFDEIIKTIPVKLISKTEKIKSNMMAIQLSAIPGVSFATALKISELYPNMNSLIDAYNTCEDDTQKQSLLSGIELTSKRKIGEAISKKVYSAITS